MTDMDLTLSFSLCPVIEFSISYHNSLIIISCIIRQSFTKISSESPAFLEHIQGDICGPIHPPTRPFRYFRVLIDASTRWSHVCLLSTRNVAFSRLLAQIIRLKTQFLDHPINTIRLDNAGEFSSQAFIGYCMSIGIDVQYSIAHVHTQNGLVESFIKRLQLIARPLLLNTKLPLLAWGMLLFMLRI